MAVINEHIHSLADLEDVLIDAELSADEIHAVLHELEPAEMAALLSRRPMSATDLTDLKEQEQLLVKTLHAFIGQLPQAQQKKVIDR